MKIACLQFNPIQENTYIVWDDTKECAVIDAGNSNPREDAALVDGRLRKRILPALSSKDQFLLDNAAYERFGVRGEGIGQMPAAEIDPRHALEVRFAPRLRVTSRTLATPAPRGALRPRVETVNTKFSSTGDHRSFRESIPAAPTCRRAATTRVDHGAADPRRLPGPAGYEVHGCLPGYGL